LILILGMISFCFAACSDDSFDTEEIDIRAGGETTVYAEFSNAFQIPAPNLTPQELISHRQGDVLFESIFVTAPAPANAGLGPLFVQNSCVSCHPKNARSAFPENSSDMGGLLARVSLPGYGPNYTAIPVPGFGTQIQSKANVGVIPEAQLTCFFTFIEGLMADGTSYTLRKPNFKLTNFYTDFPQNALLSVRIGPPVFGLGLLESVPEEEILKRADPDDRDRDGISGRPNYVFDDRYQIMRLGRFGWKANQPDLYSQTAHAFLEDMGVTSPYLSNDPSKGQVQDDGKSDDPEINDDMVKLAAFYTQSLGVPAPRRSSQDDVNYGRKLFYFIGCEKCHRAELTTGINTDFAFLSGQRIQPYTDMLLHDMGEDLADHRPDSQASGSEWRTPPLWGIGLTQVVAGHSNFLHDGRAGNIEEAILWHGGEAQKAKESYTRLSAQDRKKILAFLYSL